MPINLYASPSLDKETSILPLGMDEDGKKKPWENTKLPALRRAGQMPVMRKN